MPNSTVPTDARRMTRSEFTNMRDDLQTAQHLTECAQLAARAPLADEFDWTRLQRSIETVLGMVSDRLGDAQSNLDEHVRGIPS